MLKIEKGKPLVMWPNLLVSNFIDWPANRILDYDGDFTLTITFQLIEPVIEKSTLLSKLPSYFGIDLHEKEILLIVTEIDGNTEYVSHPFEWEINFDYELSVTKKDEHLMIIINGETIITHLIKTKLAKDDISHIVFGAGNFPKNKVNLNYMSCNVKELKIIKDKQLLAHHLFETQIHNKWYDETGNCNFIHQI
jgi:hypothetical protein